MPPLSPYVEEEEEENHIVQPKESEIDFDQSWEELDAPPTASRYQQDDVVCNECSKVFQNKRSLDCHMKEKHLRAPKMHLCPMCGASFGHKNNMKVHMRLNCKLSKKQPQDTTPGSSIHKPPFTFLQLILEALSSVKDSTLWHAEICHYVSEKHPYYRLEDKDWQHSIEQHLNRNSMFEVCEGRQNMYEGEGLRRQFGLCWRIRGKQSNKVQEFEEDGLADDSLQVNEGSNVEEGHFVDEGEESSPVEASKALKNRQELRERSCNNHFISCPPWCKSKSCLAKPTKANESTVSDDALAENDFKQEAVDLGEDDCSQGRAHQEEGNSMEGHYSDSDDNSSEGPTFQISYPWSRPQPLTIASVQSRLPPPQREAEGLLQQRIDEVISQNQAIVGDTTQFDDEAADDEEVVMDETLDEDDAQDAYNQSIQSGPLSVWLGEENDRPPFTYKQLIGQALMTEKCSGLPLMDIYSFISKRYPYFKMKNPGWQNSIRHNLSLNKWFEMVPDSNEGRRGSCWRIKEGSKFEEVLSRKVGQRWIPKAPKSQQIPKCNVCNMVFDSLPMLYSHKRREGHINVPKSHKCPDCDSEYFTKSHLARHKRQCQIPSEVNESAVSADLLTEDLSHS